MVDIVVVVCDEDSERDDCGNAEHKKNEYGNQRQSQPTKHGAYLGHIQGKDITGFLADF